jgi:formylglycine-generating enzyme required for sulfatase activity
MSLSTWGRLVVLSSLLVVPGFLPGWAQEAKDKKGAKEITNSIKMKLVLIPAGKFKMGSPKTEKDRQGDEQQHEVEITKAFYLGVHEVTQAQFKKVMGYHSSYFSKDGKEEPNGNFPYVKAYSPGAGKDAVKGLNTDDFPAENVSYEMASAFVKKLSALPEEKKAGRVYRLPTEAEWEYACRAGTTTPFHTGNSLSDKQANYNFNVSRTGKVGSYKPNAFGLYDMHGNVAEWCSDWYGKDYYAKSPRKDPSGPNKGNSRVVRGGDYANDDRSCRSARRRHEGEIFRYLNQGFRVALTVPSK